MKQKMNSEAPATTAANTGDHFKALVAHGISARIAEKLADRFHLFLMEETFGKIDAEPIGYTNAYSTDHVDVVEDEDEE